MEEHGRMQGGSCECPCHGMGSGECHMCQKMHGGGTPDPLDMSVKMWQKAFYEALMEVHIEALKKKMQAAWGPMTEKSADAVIDTMTKQWMAMSEGSAAEQELRERLAKVMKEGQQKK